MQFLFRFTLKNIKPLLGNLLIVFSFVVHGLYKLNTVSLLVSIRIIHKFEHVAGTLALDQGESPPLPTIQITHQHWKRI